MRWLLQRWLTRGCSQAESLSQHLVPVFQCESVVSMFFDRTFISSEPTPFLAFQFSNSPFYFCDKIFFYLWSHFIMHFPWNYRFGSLKITETEWTNVSHWPVTRSQTWTVLNFTLKFSLTPAEPRQTSNVWLSLSSFWAVPHWTQSYAMRKKNIVTYI